MTKCIRGSYHGYTTTNKPAVLAQLDGTRSLWSVAKEFKIPEGTLRGWKRKLDNNEKVMPGKCFKSLMVSN